MLTPDSPPNHFHSWKCTSESCRVHCGFAPVEAGSAQQENFTEHSSWRRYEKYKISAVFALLVLLTPAFAQSGGFKVQVPFEFAVGKHTLAAGEYRVSVMKPGMLQVLRIDGPGTAAVITTNAGGGPNQDRVPD